MGQYVISPKPLLGSDDVIIGGELDDELHDGGDDDSLNGGAGVDRFDDGDGIDDFEDGTDLIGLSGPDWTQLSFFPLADDVLITYGNNSILGYGAQPSDFSQDDFYAFIPN